MLHSYLSARCAASLLALAALAAPSSADQLYVATANNLFVRGNAMGGQFEFLGACFMIPQSIAVDDDVVFLGDPFGDIYRYGPAVHDVTFMVAATNDAKALAMLGNQILVGGSDGTIQRIDKTSGATIGTWHLADDVTALVVDENRLFAGSSSGRITELDVITGNVIPTLFSCAGSVAALATDETDLIVASTSGSIVRMNATTGAFDSFFDTGHAIRSIVIQGGSLLTAGPDGAIRRQNRITGASQGEIRWTSNVAAMGLARSNVGTGVCYAYDCPCGNTDGIAGCRNSTGVGSFLGGFGSASLFADDLTLTATNLPPNAVGRLFMGAARIDVPFGDGHLCAGGGIGQIRFPPQSADSNGTSRFGPGIAQFAGSQLAGANLIAPGFTGHFQAWYRNTAGPCGSGFNTTNGFDVTFTP